MKMTFPSIIKLSRFIKKKKSETEEIGEDNIPLEADDVAISKDIAELPDMQVLRTDNLVKRYGKRTVANHVTIDVTQCEIVGL